MNPYPVRPEYPCIIGVCCSMLSPAVTGFAAINPLSLLVRSVLHAGFVRARKRLNMPVHSDSQYGFLTRGIVDLYRVGMWLRRENLYWNHERFRPTNGKVVACRAAHSN